MNLTRITDPAEAALKHYADSLSLLRWIQGGRMTPRTLLDIGTGAGFPGVPLAVMRPDWEVTTIDSTRKKTDFLAGWVTELRLANLRPRHAHASHWKTTMVFDVVVMRAVGSLATCLGQGARYVKRGGRIVVYKTASMKRAELRDATATALQLNLRSAEEFPYELEVGGETLHRLLLIYRKAGQGRG